VINMDKKQTISVIALAIMLAAPGLAAAQGTLTANAGADKTLNAGETATSGSISSYNWDFGDGKTATGVTATHAYSTAGTYTATLLVVGGSGATAVDSLTVTVRSTDSTAPSITHTAVTSGTSQASIPITATVTDNVAVGSVTLYYRRSGETAFNSTTMSKSGNTYSGSVPSSVTTGSGVQYYIRAQDTRTPSPNVATLPSNAPTSVYTISLTDTAPPSITHSVPSTSPTAGTNLTLTATIADNVGVSASSVKLYYRLADSGSWSNRTMSRTSGSATEGVYSATVAIPATGVSVIQYYLEC
jgi:PKD repeat protein